MRRIITFGTFDLLHPGHLKILERARALGDHLTVGVSTDALNARKGKYSIFSEEQRLSYIRALGHVDHAFLEESLERKNEYVREFRADVLVMGDDWKGRFDWVDCDVVYLDRTPGTSSTQIKKEISEKTRAQRILFGDTYLHKHYDCAMSIINEMTGSNITPILTQTRELPLGIACDCIVYFNLPEVRAPEFYDEKPRVLIDHGASTLKWFLANKERYDYFDSIITAGPDHVKALESFFPPRRGERSKVTSGGFIKATDLMAPARYSRDEVCEKVGLDSRKPMVLFAPTWHINANRDMGRAIEEIEGLENVVTSLHPETAHLDTSRLNVVKNINGITSELLKHADVVISDTSSTLYEAAALRKPTIQIALREYSDNQATLFDFPYVAGTAELFCGGVVARPGKIGAAISDIVNRDPAVATTMRAIQDRVLAGTLMDRTAGTRIVTELLSVCTKGKRPDPASDGVDADIGLHAAHENLFFARNRVIAHGCGDFDGSHVSNSKEALVAALRAVDIAQIDVVKCRGGVIVARDGLESRYGIVTSFGGLTQDEFLEGRYEAALHPVSLKDVMHAVRDTRKAVVCDVKASREDYQPALQTIHTAAEEAGVLDRVVIQCHAKPDFECAQRSGFRRTLLAVGECFREDPVGEAAHDFVSECMAIAESSVVGISLPYASETGALASHDDPRFGKWYAFWKRLYVHGAPRSEYPAMLRMNLGVIADGFGERNEFRHLESDMDWRQYLFLNPGLVDHGVDNQISAVNHYLDYGRGEKRVSEYRVPGDFDWPTYVDMNPGLRRGGISGVDSAKAHWTKYGESEARQYTRKAA